MDIRSFKKVSDKILQTYIKKKIREAQKIASWHRPHALVAYIEDTIFAGGKRIRPYLIYLAYKLFGGTKDSEVIRFSGSAELVHTLALIHDDIIDQWEMRHNKPCFHKFAAELIATDNKDHLGMSQAILAWDLVFSWAYEILYSAYSLPTVSLAKAQKHMQAMIEEVITWQFLDGDCMVGDFVDLEKLEQKNHYKSGQYTFARPLVTGAILAGADKKSLKQLEKIGAILGKAYQMRDDILDVTFVSGDDASAYDNKTKFSDIQDGQQTYLTYYIHNNGSYTHRLAITKAMWKRLTNKQITELRAVFIESGAVAYGMWLLREYLIEAKKYIQKLSVSHEKYKQYLYEIIGMLELA